MRIGLWDALRLCMLYLDTYLSRTNVKPLGGFKVWTSRCLFFLDLGVRVSRCLFL